MANGLASIRSTAVPSLLKALNAADAGVRHHAAIALAHIDSPTDEVTIPTIPILPQALASPYLQTRAAAVDALARLGERPTLAGQIAPIFVKVLETTIDTEPIYYDLTFHDLVASALASIDLLEITKLLRSENPYVQRSAVAAIASMSDPVPIVIELLCSDDRDVRQAAIETLTRLSQFSTNDLIAALTDENGCIRTRSAIVLVEMGPKAMAVLAETLSNQSPETNQRIIEVLETIATPAARKAISSYYALGSNIVLTDDNQNVLVRYEYDVFGAIRSETGTSDNTRKFTGKEFDADSNLYYYAARYYDPYIGRFTQRDSIGDGTNWYAYVANNPLRFVDPTGLRAVNDEERLALEHTFGQDTEVPPLIWAINH